MYDYFNNVKVAVSKEYEYKQGFITRYDNGQVRVEYKGNVKWFKVGDNVKELKVKRWISSLISETI